jgi:carboxymethylenebutenolidase
MGKLLNLDVDGRTLETYLAEPAEPVKGGVIVIHEIWALNPHTKDIADRLAAEGYVALAPDLLSETDIAQHADKLQLDLFNPAKRNEAQPKLRELMAPMHEPDFADKTVANLQACFEELHKRDDVQQRVAVMGFCFGGSYSFSLAIAEPRLKLALPFYGHTTTNADELKSINCPLRAFYGEQDERLMASLPKLKSLMKTADVDFEATIYPIAATPSLTTPTPSLITKSPPKLPGSACSICSKRICLFKPGQLFHLCFLMV